MNKETTIIVNEVNIFDECERHENCVVEIWTNSTTGEVSIGWWENNNTEEPKGEPNAYR